MNTQNSDAALDSDLTHGHASSSSDEGMAEMSAYEALTLLREGKTISNVRIVGLKLKEEFVEKVEFKKCTLIRLGVEKATFEKGLHFFGCTIVRGKFNRRVECRQELQFSGSTLKRCTMAHLNVGGVTRFDGAEFVGAFRISDSRFGGRVRLWNARFGDWVEWRRCEFLDQADMRSFHAEQGVQYEECHFHEDALFRGVTVAKRFDFGNSHFEKLLDLSRSKLHDFVYVEGIVQGEAQQFAFANALADRILVTPTQLDGRLHSEATGDHAVAMQEFGLLKRMYENLHRYEEEDWAFYRFKINQRQAKPRCWARPWTKLMQACDYVFLDWGCGYGTNPFRAVGSAVMIMLIFTLIYAAGIHQFTVEQAPLSEQSFDSPLNRSLYGLVTSVSVFTAGFTGDHLNTAHGWMLLPLAVEALMGTLLWGLFIVAFSRKVIR